MDLLFYRSALRSKSDRRRRPGGKPHTQARVPGRGEDGDIILPFVLTLMAGSLLFFGLFLLNKLYEHRTKEHLNDFQYRWHRLEKKYQD
jgi:hypothetical protein